MPATPWHDNTTPPRGGWRQALEGALAVLAATAVMAVTAWTALLALGAGAIAPLSRLVPAAVSMALGGQVALASASAPSAPAGGLLGALGGSSGGGLAIGVQGEAGAVPLMLTFVGTAVLGVVFFRPLRRRARPAPALLWARAGGALATAGVLLPVAACLARGTARLPEGIAGRLGKGGGGGGPGGFGGGAGALSSVAFHADVAATTFLGLLWVVAVLGIGCLAARRTTLPRPVALSRLRHMWHPVASALTGTVTVLCCLVLAVAVLAGAAALTGREQAAKAAGALLLAGPDLLAVLLTSGLGASWEAGVRREQGDGGGLLGMLGSGAAGGAGPDRSFDLSGWPGAGVPLWLTGLALLVCLVVLVGYLTAARTPARTPREAAEALLGRHAEAALRTGVVVAVSAMACCLLSRGSLRIGFTVMGSETGGMTAALDGTAGLCGLTGCVLGALASYAGSRLHALRAARRPPADPPRKRTPRSGEERRTDRPVSSGPAP
ncbi:streptophobe family protein [Streptantibioticus cattleyicolor]|uniref:Uncharacterized protein n=1 Tax=Streptantibioticus cattleyicolor (strain ATCC 35852 / DSM 46488 / JCM 4925 / NBRC 14057 / NRRL 8057) TaxID=1003195 RepID=F8JKJ5_STREN|nr:streptophobe family protein [Streptantibioticus cattleyicolor]AEW99735.1 hypothetical protein SCATT_p15420 [Streptantibioticus cattleyicolor NRRL 8057 = DSM 46488]CCB71224.1 membrane protein of unknown function [Streptantibioticus cattleyicolor NRRL 8057 = DSM 46488]